MSLSAFLAENALSVENVKFVASKRFLSDELDDKGKRKPMEWEIKAITGTEDEALRKSCAKRFPVPGKKNQYQKETDYDLYLGKLAVPPLPCVTANTTLIFPAPVISVGTPATRTAVVGTLAISGKPFMAMMEPPQAPWQTV